jgi:hypothetical protein
MPTPSLLIVPARFKSGKLYSQLPTSGAGDFTVTRATTATRVNASGLIESVASGIPRLDYFSSDGTVGCPALLVEPSGQNLVFHSSDWTSNWNGGSSSGTTVITNSAISLAPDGTATANEIYPTSGNTFHVRASNSTTAVTYVSGTVYTQSAFFKAGVGVGTRIQLTYTSARFSQNGYANFDLIAGTVLVVSGTTADTNRAARIESYGNGWYRCSYSATCTSAGTGVGVIPGLISASGDTRNPSFSGTVTDYLLGWGAQLEVGSVATSYIPTTTAAVTRNADVFAVSGTASGIIGQTQGTIYAEVDLKNFTNATRIFAISDGTQANRIAILFNTTNRIRLLATVTSATQADINTATNQPAGIYKIAAAYALNDYALYVNGQQIGTDATALVPACSSVFLGTLETGSGLSSLNDRIRAAALYTTRLTNAELAALTTL